MPAKYNCQKNYEPGQFLNSAYADIDGPACPTARTPGWLSPITDRVLAARRKRAGRRP